MNRRELLSLFAFATPALALPRLARAEGECGPPNPYGAASCAMGIPSWRAGTIEADQDNSQWCWAACIQMVLKHYRYDIDQADIVRQVFGREVNLPADPWTLVAALNRRYVNDEGDRFGLVSGPADLAIARAELIAGRPLIVGTLGHAMVLTAFSTVETPFGFEVVDAVVRDPWPTSGGRRSLNAREFHNIEFLAYMRSEDEL